MLSEGVVVPASAATRTATGPRRCVRCFCRDRIIARETHSSNAVHQKRTATSAFKGNSAQATRLCSLAGRRALQPTE